MSRNINYVSDTNAYVTKYNGTSGYGIVDNKYTLDVEDDAAYVNKGKSWRIPSADEWAELRDKCIWTWTSRNGHYGYLVTSNVSGYTDRQIFLPASGAYDQATLSYKDSNGIYIWPTISKMEPTAI